MIKGIILLSVLGSLLGCSRPENNITFTYDVSIDGHIASVLDEQEIIVLIGLEEKLVDDYDEGDFWLSIGSEDDGQYVSLSIMAGDSSVSKHYSFTGVPSKRSYRILLNDIRASILDIEQLFLNRELYEFKLNLDDSDENGDEFKLFGSGDDELPRFIKHPDDDIPSGIPRVKLIPEDE